MKILNLFLCFIFVLFAALQYNDPDPYLWMPIYLYAAVLCWFAAKKRFYPKAYLFGIMVYVFYAGYLFFTRDGVLDWMDEHHAENIAQTMKATKPWIEDTREFFGLLLVTAALVMNYVAARKQRNLR